MAPLVPAIPLIAAAVTAGGGIAAASIASRSQRNQGSNAMSPLMASTPAKDTSSKSRGILPTYTNPLGDTSLASLSRNSLLGN